MRELFDFLQTIKMWMCTRIFSVRLGTPSDAPCSCVQAMGLGTFWNIRGYLRLTLGLCLWCFTPTTPTVWANQSKLPQELKDVGIQKALGQSIDLNLKFTDSSGKQRPLRDFFDGNRPVLLTLNYFRCPMLCTLQLNGLLEVLRELSPDMDQKFRMLTISFDHTEGHTLAQLKQKNYRAQLEKRPLDWNFLVGTQPSIQSLTQTLRYTFRYVAKEKQYAHPAVIYVLTPQGKVSQYLAGIKFKVRDLKFALIEASQGKMGNWIDAFVMSCFVYNPEEGKYTGFAFGIVRLGGGLTVLTLALLLGFLWIRERRRRFHEVESPT